MNDFFRGWYELLANFSGFSGDMDKYELYAPIGFCMVLIPVAVLTIYYYVINSSKFSKWWHWLLLVILICAINFGIAFGVSYNGISNNYGGDILNLYNTPLVSYCVSFSFINTLWSFVVSFVWSMIIKWGSSQCKWTPF